MTSKRSLLRHFINSTPTATADTYELIGEGVTEGTMNYNAQNTQETYIHQDVANSSVDSYQPQLPLTGQVAPGDDAFDFIDGIRQGNATYGTPSIGGDDLTDIVEVRMYEAAETDGVTYPATQFNGQVQIDTIGGAGGGKAEIGWTFNVQGTPVPGTFNTSTLAFTAI